MNDTRIVNAIQARIDGRLDDPDLQSVGALHDRIGDIVEILSMRDRTPGNTTVEEFTEFMEADSLQGCRESDRIAEGLDAMGNPTEAEDRTRIGNTPSCDLCGGLHGSDHDCQNHNHPTDEEGPFPDCEACKDTQPKEYIDLTPVGCQTPEGRKRVDDAQREWDSATHALANATKEIMTSKGGIKPYEIQRLLDLSAAMDRKQEAFLRAVAGR